jgi:hypothetical protein
MGGMRSPLLLSVLLAASVGACGQSLTNMTGTGGSVAGTGGATGGVSGNGGTGGIVNGSVCNALTAEYQSALTAAEGCQVGAANQCGQLVSGNLSGCSCPTYVTDSSALTTIEDAWQAAGCQPVEPPCKIFCPAALNTTCVSTDGGTAGFCSYVPGTGGVSGTGGDGATGGTSGAGGSSGATGGTSGAGGSATDGGLSACGTLVAEYAAVMVGAKSCTAGAAGQCAQLVPTSLTPCATCTDYVTDSSVLLAIQQKWDAAGCANVAVLCPAIACRAPTSSMCLPSDAGGAVCSSGF